MGWNHNEGLTLEAPLLAGVKINMYRQVYSLWLALLPLRLPDIVKGIAFSTVQGSTFFKYSIVTFNIRPMQDRTSDYSRMALHSSRGLY